MAKFNVVGLDDLQNSMLRQEQIATEAVPEMLKAGGAVMQKAQEDEITSTFKGDRSTGDLAKSIVVSKVKDKDSGKMVEVYPDGKDRHGVRNATKGFVLQYGRSNMPARPWFTAANTKAADDVNAEMRRVWEEKQDGR
ncbi:HK97 gp10 family phage protein [Eubacteriales bacterium OttesenSCG-928-N13]|nr:HK97 gp10 family phage protein [Eubacteriales bacterium OttesenSCG-928-N13]